MGSCVVHSGGGGYKREDQKPHRHIMYITISYLQIILQDATRKMHGLQNVQAH